MKQSFTLQPPGRTVDSFFIQSPYLNCLSILSAAYTFSNTANAISCWVWPFSPKWKLIGLSFLSRASRRCSVIRSRNSLCFPDIYSGPVFGTYYGLKQHLEPHLEVWQLRVCYTQLCLVMWCIQCELWLPHGLPQSKSGKTQTSAITSHLQVTVSSIFRKGSIGYHYIYQN